jgi:glycosyltransferase involved in cell wall biosynthesis
VVFAHVPPPHHGQSAMVKLMLDGLRTSEYGNFEIHHVDARFSDTMEDIGGRGLGKVLRALCFACKAVRYRIQYGVKTLYYIPAPPKGAAMARDWLVLALCRPFFPRLILHWHAVGLGEWTNTAMQNGNLVTALAARLNRALLGRHDRSFVLTDWGRADVAVFKPREVRVVSNGIPDPCPDFEASLLARRRQRVADLRLALSGEGEVVDFRVCFLGHCTAEKGLWDAMAAVAAAISTLKGGNPKMRLRFRVAGEFPTANDREHFASLCGSLKQTHHLEDDWIAHVGFVSGMEKRRFLEEADCLFFPTRYAAESFGLVAVEALAFGIPPVTSDWRMLPEIMNRVGLPVSRAGDPDSLATGLISAIGRDDPAVLRAAFLEHFTAEAHLRHLADALI